jgi:hypothetical protein
MGVLRGTADERKLLQRYVRQLSDHENRLLEFSQAGSAAAARRASVRTTFDDAVKELAIHAAEPGTTCR